MFVLKLSEMTSRRWFREMTDEVLEDLIGFTVQLGAQSVGSLRSTGGSRLAGR